MAFSKIIKERPTAYILLSIIAQRAYHPDISVNSTLEPGEALIGDYEIYGVTEQIYRTDKEYLLNNHFITIKSTNRGTIAKLADTTIFDINLPESNEPSNEQATNNQRPTNEQLTTNKEIKKLRNKEIKSFSYKKEGERDNSQLKPIGYNDFKRYIVQKNILTGEYEEIPV